MSRNQWISTWALLLGVLRYAFRAACTTRRRNTVSFSARGTSMTTIEDDIKSPDYVCMTRATPECSETHGELGGRVVAELGIVTSPGQEHVSTVLHELCALPQRIDQLVRFSSSPEVCSAAFQSRCQLGH